MRSNYKTVFSILILTALFSLASTNISAQKKENAKLAAQAKITMDAARETALKRAPGTIEEGTLEKENGKLIYSFDIRTSDREITEVQVDAKTGEIVSVEKEDAAKEAAEKKQDSKKDDDDEEDAATRSARIARLAKQAKITMQQAREIALKRVSGTITGEDLEKEKGRLQYSFDIRDANGKVFDVEIDAKTGQVLKAVEDTED
ncbi:MAG TPA: PepSY domain-containing protein [Pyrinomonadaceae bacterium]|jgi:uncharacterized membrane protein YkoI|nr:hypothetical protein [Acidobacteriota bacterium]